VRAYSGTRTIYASHKGIFRRVVPPCSDVHVLEGSHMNGGGIENNTTTIVMCRFLYPPHTYQNTAIYRICIGRHNYYCYKPPLPPRVGKHLQRRGYPLLTILYLTTNVFFFFFVVEIPSKTKTIKNTM